MCWSCTFGEISSWLFGRILLTIVSMCFLAVGFRFMKSFGEEPVMILDGLATEESDAKFMTSIVSNFFIVEKSIWTNDGFVCLHCCWLFYADSCFVCAIAASLDRGLNCGGSFLGSLVLRLVGKPFWRFLAFLFFVGCTVWVGVSWRLDGPFCLGGGPACTVKVCTSLCCCSLLTCISSSKQNCLFFLYYFLLYSLMVLFATKCIKSDFCSFVCVGDDF